MTNEDEPAGGAGDQGLTGAGVEHSPSLSPRDGLSHVVGPSTPALMPVTIPEMMQSAVAQHSENLAIVSSHQDVRRTYAELNREVLNLAAGFLSLGLEQGDRVGIWAPNCYEWVLTQLATARIGCSATIWLRVARQSG